MLALNTNLKEFQCWDFLGLLRAVSGVEFTTACRPFVGHRKREKRSFCRPDRIPTGPRQGADNAGYPQSEEDQTEGHQDGDQNVEGTSTNSVSEKNGGSDNTSHPEELLSHVSLEHRRRDTTSPEGSYMERK